MLVEDADPANRWASERVLRRSGYDVATCGGPEEMGGRPCPETADGLCPLVAGADVVYSNLRWGEPASRGVLHAVRVHHQQTPVVVEVPAPQESELGDLLAGCHVIHRPASPTAMLRAVQMHAAGPDRMLASDTRPSAGRRQD